MTRDTHEGTLPFPANQGHRRGTLGGSRGTGCASPQVRTRDVTRDPGERHHERHGEPPL